MKDDSPNPPRETPLHFYENEASDSTQEKKVRRPPAFRVPYYFSDKEPVDHLRAPYYFSDEELPLLELRKPYHFSDEGKPIVKVRKIILYTLMALLLISGIILILFTIFR